mmetsp:Transcript_20394/g.30961  ORF Transcript_20394/g.30961 Transcript_20394/m.30961 type:complete len:89 (+) Transcript_20394:246-512(+)
MILSKGSKPRLGTTSKDLDSYFIRPAALSDSLPEPCGTFSASSCRTLVVKDNAALVIGDASVADTFPFFSLLYQESDMITVKARRRAK